MVIFRVSWKAISKYLSIPVLCISSYYNLMQLNCTCRPDENGQTCIKEKQFHTFSCDVRITATVTVLLLLLIKHLLMPFILILFRLH
jgi:hypothetical protein